jgi:hypothetical protein
MSQKNKETLSMAVSNSQTISKLRGPLFFKETGGVAPYWTFIKSIVQKNL